MPAQIEGRLFLAYLFYYDNDDVTALQLALKTFCKGEYFLKAIYNFNTVKPLYDTFALVCT